MSDIVNFEEIFQVLEDFLQFDDNCICEIDDMTDEELDTLTRILSEIIIEEKKRGQGKV